MLACQWVLIHQTDQSARNLLQDSTWFDLKVRSRSTGVRWDSTLGRPCTSKMGKECKQVNLSIKWDLNLYRSTLMSSNSTNILLQITIPLSLNCSGSKTEEPTSSSSTNMQLWTKVRNKEMSHRLSITGAQLQAPTTQVEIRSTTTVQISLVQPRSNGRLRLKLRPRLRSSAGHTRRILRLWWHRLEGREKEAISWGKLMSSWRRRGDSSLRDDGCDNIDKI